jgi:hypothetical protein
MVSLLDAGIGEEINFEAGLRESKFTRVKTPIGNLVYGGRSGMGHGWYWYPNDLAKHVKSFGKRWEAVEFIRGELHNAGLLVDAGRAICSRKAR